MFSVVKRHWQMYHHRKGGFTNDHDIPTQSQAAKLFHEVLLNMPNVPVTLQSLKILKFNDGPDGSSWNLSSLMPNLNMNCI